MIVERVLLIRHGQTDWNMEGRWQGTLPVPLNEDGWRQARALARYLQRRPIAAIYSSDLARAWQTAVTIGDAVGIQPQPEPRLREFNLGIFQGLTREEMIEKYPMEWETYRENHWDYHIPEGESRRDLQARMYQAWLEIVVQPIGPEVALVSHGGALKTLLMKLFENSVEVTNVVLENTSVTTVERKDGLWCLGEVATVAHLSQHMPTRNDSL